MSKRIIAKFSVFVIFAAIASTFFAGCAFVSSNADVARPVSTYDPPKVNGQIKSADITESSGIAASRCQNDVLWTHNDSGDDTFIFAINGSGDNLGTWKIPDAENIDWEDIATYKDRSGKCFIYVGEIGDNKTKRHVHVVYRVAEPVVVPDNAGSNRKEPLTTVNAEILEFSYPDFDQDAETLMVHPKTGYIFVITKCVSGPAGVYSIKPEFNTDVVEKAERLAEISVPAVPNGFLTGGDISPDGRRVILCDYTQAYEYVLPEGDSAFENIWKQKPEKVDLGKRKGGESVGYSVDGNSIFATSEGRNSPVIEVKRR